MATWRNAQSALASLSRHVSCQRPKVCPLPAIRCRFKSDSGSSYRKTAPIRLPSVGTGGKVPRVSPNAAQQLNLDSTPFESVEAVVNSDKETFNLRSAVEYYDDLKRAVEFIRQQGSILAVYPPTGPCPTHAKRFADD